MKVIQGYVHKVPKNSRTVENSGSIQGLGNCPPTPPLTQHFAPSEVQMLTLSPGG